MELNGLIAVAVTLGTIGHVLFLCQNKTQTLHSHSCVYKMGVRTCNLFEQDMHTPTPQPRHQVRHPEKFLFFHSSTMAREKKGKKRAPKQPAKKRKEVHKIRWNPNSAHKNQQLQKWTEQDMITACEMYQEGKLSQREISRRTGIHLATLNKRFRGLVKGTKGPYRRYVNKRDTK